MTSIFWFAAFAGRQLPLACCAAETVAAFLALPPESPGAQ
jgi:hypothetical protein